MFAPGITIKKRENARAKDAIVGLFVALSGGPATADVRDECHQIFWSDTRLRTCSEIIDGSSRSPEEKALGYIGRGEARAEAGAFCRSDCGFYCALQLQRNQGPALAGRGYARFAVGDFVGAIKR